MDDANGARTIPERRWRRARAGQHSWLHLLAAIATAALTSWVLVSSVSAPVGSAIPIDIAGPVKDTAVGHTTDRGNPWTLGTDDLSAVHSCVAQAVFGEFPTAAVPMRWPVADGDVTSPFGTRIDPWLGALSAHNGIDIGTAYDAAVFASAPGAVASVAFDTEEGLVVQIEHEASVVTRYAHLSTILVRTGDAVSLGDAIGRVGLTGRSTGPHLHFEVWIGDSAVDPLPLLQSRTSRAD